MPRTKFWTIWLSVSIGLLTYGVVSILLEYV